MLDAIQHPSCDLFVWVLFLHYASHSTRPSNSTLLKSFGLRPRLQNMKGTYFSDPVRYHTYPFVLEAIQHSLFYPPISIVLAEHDTVLFHVRSIGWDGRGEWWNGVCCGRSRSLMGLELTMRSRTTAVQYSQRNTDRVWRIGVWIIECLGDETSGRINWCIWLTTALVRSVIGSVRLELGDSWR
jgi:hypothetical protein